MTIITLFATIAGDEIQMLIVDCQKMPIVGTIYSYSFVLVWLLGFNNCVNWVVIDSYNEIYEQPNEVEEDANLAENDVKNPVLVKFQNEMLGQLYDKNYYQKVRNFYLFNYLNSLIPCKKFLIFC